jgi:peptidoglycan/LPS O-acetylase OafA/YrhL/CubicO group peptidase (beta-lactamase class C family)
MSDRRSATPNPSRQGETRLPYIPGLDGLRALAVVAVLLYHAGLPVRGGFLGVESFFVVSGFLITALLLVEWRQRGRIDLPAFWLRRARRLLPALFFLLAGTLVFVALRMPRELREVRDDTLAALVYVMNWRLIAGEQSYFDPLVRPPLLQHLWSLAVEEQFYLFWPLLFALGARLLRAASLLAVTLLVAVGSAMLMAALYRPGADPSRIYYGTDTRAMGLLLGAALALVWTPDSTQATTGRRVGVALDGAAIMALGGLIACFFMLSDRLPLLYRGGFVVIATLTAIVIAALAHPGARLMPRLLGWRPLRVIGLRSYGLYLWHWPVFMVTRPALDVPLKGLPLLALRLAIVGALVELSYRYIEMPVRRGAVERAWHRFWGVTGEPHPARRSLTGAYALLWLCVLIPSLLLLTSSLGSSMGRVARSAPAAAGRGAASRSAVETATAALPAVVAPAPTASPLAEEVASLLTTAPTVSTVTPAPTVSLTAEPAVGASAAVLPPVSAATTPAPTVEAPPAATPIPTSTQPALPTAMPTTAAPRPMDPALIAALQQVLDDTVADGFIPGAVLSINVPGYLPWSGASGIADHGRDLAMAPETLIHLGSVTKMFTAVVALQLVDEGKLDLDAPIGKYLPGVVALEDTTTVRHLLQHTSGIYDYLEDREYFVPAYQNPEHNWKPEELAEPAQLGPAFRPGAEGQWAYSSTNYVIVGMLIEKVTGRTLAREMRQRIFDRAALKHTFFAPDEALKGNLAQGYIDASDRANVSMTFVFGTGNIISTADDLRRFVDALFGGRLLRAESLAKMTALMDTGGAYGMPELKYGLGMMSARLNVGPKADGAERPDEISVVLGHIGGIAGSRAAAWHVPATGITIALGINQADVDPNLLARDVLQTILTWQGQ